MAGKKEKFEKLVELLLANPKIKYHEIPTNLHWTLRKSFGGINNAKRALRLDAYISKTYSSKLPTPEEVDKNFAELTEKLGRHPTYEEFYEHFPSSYYVIRKGLYPNVKSWKEYIRSKGYEPYDNRGVISDEQIIELIERGLSDAEIARKLGRITRKGVAYRRKKLGYPPFSRKKFTDEQLEEAIKKSGSYSAAARLLGVNSSSLAERAKKKGIESPYIKRVHPIKKFLKEQGPSLGSEIIAAVGNFNVGRWVLYEGKDVCSFRIPGYKSKLYFLKGQEEEAKKKKIFYINKKIEPLLEFIKANPDCTRTRIRKEGFDSIIRSCFDDSLDKAKIIQRCIQLGRRDLANQLLQQIKNLDLKDMETLVSLYQNEAQNQEEDVKIEYIDVLREPSTARIYTESTETEIGDILPKKHFKGRRVIVKGLKQAEMPKEIPILLRLERAKNTIDSYFIHKKELEGKEEYLREGYRITRAYQSSYRLLQNLLNLEELEGKTVLDLGCGSNSPLMQVLKDKKINANVVGLDSHKKSLQICKEKFSENEFIQGLYPYTLFSFRSNSFDWIFAINCLHYTNEKSEICATLIGLDQLLKKGGRIVIIEPRSQSKMKFNAELKKNLSEMGYNVEEYNKYIKWPGPQYSHHLILVGEKINEVDRSQEYKKAIAASLIKTNRFEEAKKIVEDLGLTLSDIIKEKEKEMVCIRKPEIRKVYKEPKRVFSFEENLKLYSLIKMVKTTKIYSRDLAEKMFDKIFNYYFQKTEKLKKFRPYVGSR